MTIISRLLQQAASLPMLPEIPCWPTRSTEAICSN
jgi:hypothetical protein